MDTVKLLNVIFFVLLGLYAISSVLFVALKIKGVKILNIVFLSLILAYVIVRLVFGIKTDAYDSASELGIYLSTFLLIILIIVLVLVFDKEKFSFSTKSIAYAGITIALSFALSYIKVEFLAGSITLASALPIIIYSYIFGGKKGVLIGAIFGVLQFVQKATVYHPMQVILDYPVAFAFLGLGGIFKNIKKKAVVKFIIMSVVALFGRYISHVLSGYFIFGIFAGYYGFNSAILYSLVYNLNVLIDLAIVLVIGIIIFCNKSFNLQLQKLAEK